MRSGAVSPNAWAIPIIVPVKIPGAARGKIWSVAVCILDAPRPRAASLIEVGTALIDALVAIIIVGKVIKANTIPPTKGTDLGIPKKPRNTASPRSPKTIEGTAAKLLILTSMKSVILPGLAKYSKYIADITARGKASINVINKAKADPTAAPRIPALSGSLESALVKKVELKNRSNLPSSFNLSIHSICLSLNLRFFSGELLSICPFISISTSSEVFIQVCTLLPISKYPFSTFNLNW